MIVFANKDYGIACHTCEFCETFNCSAFDFLDKKSRYNHEFIKFYTTHENGHFGFCYIPPEATDWDLFVYDGLEWVVFVQDGKLNYSYPQ